VGRTRLAQALTPKCCWRHSDSHQSFVLGTFQDLALAQSSC